MFFGTIAATMIAASVSDNARRMAEARGEKITPEEFQALRGLIAEARGVLADERTAYEDAGLLPVYPRP